MGSHRTMYAGAPEGATPLPPSWSVIAAALMFIIIIITTINNIIISIIITLTVVVISIVSTRVGGVGWGGAGYSATKKTC